MTREGDSSDFLMSSSSYIILNIRLSKISGRGGVRLVCQRRTLTLARCQRWLSLG